MTGIRLSKAPFAQQMFSAPKFCSKWQSNCSLTIKKLIPNANLMDVMSTKKFQQESPYVVLTGWFLPNANLIDMMATKKFQQESPYVVLTGWFLLINHKGFWWTANASTERRSSALESSDTILSRNLVPIDVSFAHQNFVRANFCYQMTKRRQFAEQSVRQNLAKYYGNA